MASYSSTPLAAKLGIKPNTRVLPIGAPAHYLALLSPLPDGASIDPSAPPTSEIIHIFTDRRAALEDALRTYRGAMSPAATIWVSWPKKAAKLPTDITEDVVREVALPMGFVDVKVCAIDDVWSGLKLVIRKELR